MASQTVVSMVHLVASNAQVKELILAKILAIIEYSKAKEPGVLKYALCLPDTQSTADDESIYIIEEYASKQIYDTHMSSPPVVDLLQSAEKLEWLQASTKVYMISWIATAMLSRNDRLPSQLGTSGSPSTNSRVKSPYVLFATITDPDPRDIDTLEPFGAAIVKYATENEPDTLFYADGRPLDLKTGKVSDAPTGDSGGFICAVEVYASKDACEAHLKDASVQNLGIQGHKLGSKFDIKRMIVTEGWLIRE